MCLAVPAKIIDINGSDAVVDVGGNRLKVNAVLTPSAAVDAWVLVHAGFAISTIDEADALETWTYLKACYDGDMSQVEDELGGSPGNIETVQRGVSS